MKSQKKKVLIRHVQRKTALVKGNLYFMAYCSKLSLKGESIKTPIIIAVDMY